MLYCCRCPVFQSRRIHSGHRIVPWIASHICVGHRTVWYSTGEEKRLIRTIRQACKTDNSSAAFEAFSQLQALDHSTSPDVLNSLLHVSTTAGDEGAFRSILDLVKGTTSKQDVVTQSLLISALCQFGHSDQALELCHSLEETEGLVPRRQALQAVLQACIKSGNPEGVRYAMSSLQSRYILPEPGSSVAVVEAVTQGPLHGEHGLVLQLLSAHESLGRPADVDLLNGVATWAER